MPYSREINFWTPSFRELCPQATSPRQCNDFPGNQEAEGGSESGWTVGGGSIQCLLCGKLCFSRYSWLVERGRLYVPLLLLPIVVIMRPTGVKTWRPAARGVESIIWAGCSGGGPKATTMPSCTTTSSCSPGKPGSSASPPGDSPPVTMHPLSFFFSRTTRKLVKNYVLHAWPCETV